MRRRGRRSAARSRSGCGAETTVTTTDRLAAVAIDADIARARTLPAWIYSDADVFRLQKTHVFARSWQFACDADRVKVPGAVSPVMLLEGGLDEPLLFA